LPVEPQQALADLTEISSQIKAAVVFDDKGKVAASTLADSGRAEELTRWAAQLLADAEPITTGESPLAQLEASTLEGSVFVVREGARRIAATTGPQPTVGLVFYDLKSALRQIGTAAPAKRKRTTPKRPAATKPKAAAAKKPAPRRKPAPKKKPDAS